MGTAIRSLLRVTTSAALTGRASAPAAIKSATESLSQSLSKIGEAMMKDQQASGAAGANQQGGDTPPDAAAGATDAEFTEK